MTDSADSQPVTATDNLFTTANNAEVVSNANVTNDKGITEAADATRIQPRQIISGVSRGIQQLGSPNIYVDSGNEQIIVASEGLPQIMMGNQITFGKGLYVTESGIDVTTNTDPSKFLFNSNLNMLKIVTSGIYTNKLTATSGVTVFTIPHNLGYIPIAIVYLTDATGSSYTALPAALAFNFVTNVNIQLYSDFNMDSTNLYINLENASGIGTGGIYTWKYYLLQETAN